MRTDGDGRAPPSITRRLYLRDLRSVAVVTLVEQARRVYTEGRRGGEGGRFAISRRGANYGTVTIGTNTRGDNAAIFISPVRLPACLPPFSSLRTSPPSRGGAILLSFIPVFFSPHATRRYHDTRLHGRTDGRTDAFLSLRYFCIPVVAAGVN